MADCTCDDWKNNIGKMLMAEYLWAHGIEYDGVLMRFCPWCGRKFGFREARRQCDTSEENKVRADL